MQYNLQQPHAIPLNCSHITACDVGCRGLNQGAAAASAATTDKLGPQNLSEPTGITEASKSAPSALEHDQEGLNTADADGLSSQHAADGSGEDASCSVEQQSAAPEGGSSWAKATQQASSSADFASVTVIPARRVSAGFDQHAQHPAGHESSPAQVSPAASAANSTSCTAASTADDKGAGSDVSAAVNSASKHLFKLAAPKPGAAATAGVPVMPGADRDSGGSVEVQQSSVPVLRPAQTAAEMLSWLDATLSAKKPMTSKAAGKAAPKVQHNGQLQPHMLSRICTLFTRFHTKVCCDVGCSNMYATHTGSS